MAPDMHELHMHVRSIDLQQWLAICVWLSSAGNLCAVMVTAHVHLW